MTRIHTAALRAIAESIMAIAMVTVDVCPASWAILGPADRDKSRTTEMDRCTVGTKETASKVDLTRESDLQMALRLQSHPRDVLLADDAHGREAAVRVPAVALQPVLARQSAVPALAPSGRIGFVWGLFGVCLEFV